MIAATTGFGVAFVVLPIPVGLVLGWLVVTNVEDRPTKTKLLAAIAASVVLCYVTLLLSLCSVSENSALPHPRRCEGGTPLTPLLGIPPLVMLAIFAGPTRGPWPWMSGVGILAAAVVLPYFWLMG